MRSPSVSRPARAAGPLLALALWLAATPAQAWPPRVELKGDAFASAYSQLPYQDLTQHPSFYFYDPDFLPPDPQVRQTHRRSADVRLGNLAHVHADVEATVGLLRAQATASYPDLGGGAGLGVATASATFADTVLVGGAGLATGAAVTYRVDFHISGTVQNQIGQGGPFDRTYADATALVRLEDLTTGQQVQFDWRSKNQSTGLYSVALNTAVGHELRLAGNLFVGAWADSSSSSSRTSAADFMNTAVFNLAPSVEGLNTIGASGHDFASPVPEPGSWVLMLAGLLAVTRLRRRREACHD